MIHSIFCIPLRIALVFAGLLHCVHDGFFGVATGVLFVVYLPVASFPTNDEEELKSRREEQHLRSFYAWTFVSNFLMFLLNGIVLMVGAKLQKVKYIKVYVNVTYIHIALLVIVLLLEFLNNHEGIARK